MREEIDRLAEAYYEEAANCGYGGLSPNTRTATFNQSAPDYLKHTSNQEIQVLLVGDTIFLTNPSIPVSMSEGSLAPTNNIENYIEIIQSAGERVYTVELVNGDTNGSNGGETYTTVSKVEVLNGDFQDDDGACTLIGTAREVLTSGEDKLNLDIRLTVRGQQVLEGNGNSESDYECKYVTDVQIFNGGSGWVVGDVVTMTVSGREYQIRVKETGEFTSSAKASTSSLLRPQVLV